MLPGKRGTPLPLSSPSVFEKLTEISVFLQSGVFFFKIKISLDIEGYRTQECAKYIRDIRERKLLSRNHARNR